MYKTETISTNRTLTGKEKLMLTDTSNAIPLDKATQDGATVAFTPAIYGEVKFTDESGAKKPFTKYVFIDTEGNKYSTGSETFWNSYKAIEEAMADSDEEWAIEVFSKPSKNYTGKCFISCCVI